MSDRDPATAGPPAAPPAGASEKEVIRDEIQRTREELGETAAALSSKTDVKAQASAKADELKQRAREVGDQAKSRADDVAGEVKQRPAPVAVGIALLMSLWLMRRRRRRRKSLEASTP